MGQFEQDWLELGSRVPRSLHCQHRRNLRLVQAAEAEEEALALTVPVHQHAPETAKEAAAMADTHVTITGNLTDDPEVTFTPTAPPSATSGWP